jgi:hypothetical protein
VPINIAIASTGATYGATLPTCPNANCDAACISNCNSDDCGGYGTCTFVPFNKVTNPLLLARKKISGTSLRLKYIYNKPAGNYTYKIFETDNLGNPLSTTPLTSNTVTSADMPLSPKEYVVTGITAGQHFYKVIVDGTTDESPVVDEVFP